MKIGKRNFTESKSCSVQIRSVVFPRDEFNAHDHIGPRFKRNLTVDCELIGVASFRVRECSECRLLMEIFQIARKKSKKKKEKRNRLDEKPIGKPTWNMNSMNFDWSSRLFLVRFSDCFCTIWWVTKWFDHAKRVILVNERGQFQKVHYGSRYFE